MSFPFTVTVAVPNVSVIASTVDFVPDFVRPLPAWAE
jgi:hypothetical protein